MIRVTLNQCKKKHHGRQRMIPMGHEILYAKLEEDQKEERKEQGDLYERLCCLPERYRRVIELYYIEEISTEVIAQYLKLSKSAVRKRLQRGREMLREKGANVDE